MAKMPGRSAKQPPQRKDKRYSLLNEVAVDYKILEY